MQLTWVAVKPGMLLQVVIGLTNATITGGVYAMAAWLPPLYLQVHLTFPGCSIVSKALHVKTWVCLPHALQTREADQSVHDPPWTY